MSLTETPQPPTTGRSVENSLSAARPGPGDLSLPAEDERQLERVEMFELGLAVLELRLGQAHGRAAVRLVPLTWHRLHLGQEDGALRLPLLDGAGLGLLRDSCGLPGDVSLGRFSISPSTTSTTCRAV